MPTDREQPARFAGPEPARGSEPGVMAPRGGDVIVCEESVSPPLYTISTFPEPPQLRCGSRSEAVERAQRFATLQRVDCWLTRGDQSFTLLRRHRPAR